MGTKQRLTLNVTEANHNYDMETILKLNLNKI